MRKTQASSLINKLSGRGALTLCLLTFQAVVLTPWGFVAPPTVRAVSPRNTDVPRTCTERIDGSLGATGHGDLFWKDKSELKVLFLGGSEALRAQVRKHAATWNQYTGVPFVFVESGPSDIRVSFKSNGKTGSYVGNTAARVGADDPTMNFGWFDEDETTDSEFRRPILHEFGHALGLVHEHQSPGARIKWNKEAVYQYYRKHYGWNANVVEDNIFKRYERKEMRATAYDSASIMHYPIPANFTTDGSSVDWNTSLSRNDIALISRVYPRSTRSRSTPR